MQSYEECIYIWCSRDQILDITEYFVRKKKCRVHYLVWCKTNCVPATNDTWLPNIEHCLVFKESKAPRYNDGYDLKSKWYISSTNKEDKDLYLHPTCKPLDLVKRHLLHSSNEGDIILDTFAGSGTSLVAAKELNRHYLGFEINPEYYKIAVDRLNGLSQKDRKRKDLGILDMFDFGVEIND
jgi:DNA modification methylase